MLHAPAPVRVTFAGLELWSSVHCPESTEKLTGRPDVAEAKIVNGGVPYVLVGMDEKKIV
jgi:hypothetical protein